MCGIVGSISLSNVHVVGTDRRKFMEQALMIDTLRGEHSTGVFYRQKGGPKATLGWAKNAVDGYRFVNSPEFNNITKQVNNNWFMVGHNRYATVGGVSTETAHPFVEGPISMVHNGTLSSTWALPKSQRELGVEVDSHALCHNLGLVSPEDVGKEVIEKIDGAFALVWHDSRDASLNIVRNTRRPLHFAKAASSDTIYFASEAGQLRWLDERISLDLDSVYQLKPGAHLKWTEENIYPTVKEYDLTSKRSNFRTAGGQTRTYTQGTTTSGNYSPSTSNRVRIRGMWTAVPDAMQELMLNEHLVVEDRFNMIPMAIVDGVNQDDKHAVVSGHITTLDLNCLVYNVHAITAASAFNREWSIRPIGLRYTGDGTAVVIGIVENFNAEYTSETWNWFVDELEAQRTRRQEERAQQASDFPVVYEDGTDEEDDEEEEHYQGPWGIDCSKENFESFVKEGCAYCTDPIPAEDHEEIIWYDNAHPLCAMCSAGFQEHGDEFFGGAMA